MTFIQGQRLGGWQIVLTSFFILLFSANSHASLDFSEFSVRGFEGKGPLEFNSPEDIVITANGEVVVADHKNHRLQILAEDGSFLKFIPDTSAKSPEGLSAAEAQAFIANQQEIARVCKRPTGLAIDNNGRLYVTSFESDRIAIIDIKEGKLLGTLGRSGKAQGELNGPMGIAISKDNKIAVAEFKARRVQILDDEGKCLKELIYQEEKKKGGYSAVAPRGVHWLADGSLIVAYPLFHQVVCWEPFEGKIVWSYGTKGSGKGMLNNPSFIIDAKDGNYLISDTGNHRLVEITKEGKFFEHHGRKGSAPGRLINPRGMALSKEETLFVSDQGNNRVHLFQPGQATLMLREIKQMALKDEWLNAMPKIERVLYLQPNNSQALDLMVNGLYYFGNQAFNAKDYDKAEEYYRRIIRYRPDDPHIPQKLDAIFWAANQSLIATVVGGIIATIIALILIWILKLLLTRYVFNKS